MMESSGIWKWQNAHIKDTLEKFKFKPLLRSSSNNFEHVVLPTTKS